MEAKAERLSPQQTARSDWMGLLSRSRPGHLADLMPQPLPAYDLLRGPEIGAVMVRGRAGAVGAAFNLGEMSVTRCAIRLASGEVGHANVQGRDKAHATHAAIVDALMQTADAAALRTRVLTPLAEAEMAARKVRAEKAAATRVEFFTVVRGEDQ